MTQLLFSADPDQRDDTHLVLVLHGYGSNERRIANQCFSMLPEGTTGLAIRGGFPTGDDEWGWFLLDYFLANDFAEVIAAAHRVFDVLDSEEVTAHRYRSVSLLGHSQGMAMATTLARLRPEAFRCVVGLSGFVLSNPLLASLDGTEDIRHPYFWGRDVDDLVINPDAITFTTGWLDQWTRLTARTYPGMGHTIGEEMGRDVNIFLRHHLLTLES